MAVRISIGLVITFVMLAIAGRRFFWLGRLITSGQPAVPSRAKDIPKRLKAELVEVAGQKKLLQWSVPGTAHFFTMWGFTVLILTIIEAFGCLFQRNFHIPIIGTWGPIGFLEDFFAVAVLVSLVTFVVIRVKHSPKRENRRSRFFGSHTGAAWLVLLAISGVIISLLLYRAAQVNTGNFPYGWAAFASHGLAKALAPLGTGVNSVIETTAEALPITWSAFCLAVITGGLMFSSNAVAYAHNGFFQTKMALIGFAGLNMMVYHSFVARGAASWHTASSTPLRARLVGGVSLALWIAVAACGRWVGFTINAPT